MARTRRTTCETCRHIIRFTHHGWQDVMLARCRGCVDCVATDLCDLGPTAADDLAHWAFRASMRDPKP